ncbi:MAG: sensor histidine kinase [Verrucomicrobiae bacterium]|nr:sensor histidine kinase [Verrucomicrobiae bacterium]
MDANNSGRIRNLGLLGGLIMLATVGYLDYVTGYELTLLSFYFFPILFVLRYAGLGFAFMMAVLAALVWLVADRAAGKHYNDYLIPIWNTGIRLSVFVLVVILFSARRHLQKTVVARTEDLQVEIGERVRLEKELLEISEAEQRRIGHDLHDSLGQHLTATAMAAKLLAKKIHARAEVEPLAADRLVALVEEAIDLTRKLARTLHPIELGSAGLADALQELAANLAKAFSISCQFRHSGTAALNDPQAAIQLYRIAQEAASNAIRHGHARAVLICLDAAGKSLMLSITDDGTGLPDGVPKRKGMGLRIMAYRANLIGASFDIQNLPAGGTRAVCVLNPDPAVPENHGVEK